MEEMLDLDVMYPKHIHKRNASLNISTMLLKNTVLMILKWNYLNIVKLKMQTFAKQNIS